MSESKHTPGPWEVRGNAVFARSTGDYVSVPQWRKNGPTNTEYLAAQANASLIAAAPDLLEALEFLTDAAETEPEMAIYKAHIEQARAAIAKAKGKV